MTLETRPSPRALRTRAWARDGARLGVLAGVAFAAALVLASAVSGDPPLLPFRWFASVIWGRNALVMLPWVALVLGALVHLGLSALFGAFYAGAMTRFFGARTMRSRSRQAVLGSAYGLLLWAVNFQLLARLLYPWLLETPPLVLAVLHAIGYGLPLGLALASVANRGGAFLPGGAPQVDRPSTT